MAHPVATSRSAAVAASMASPVSAISIARLRPILRATATKGVWQNKLALPPGIANPAVSAASARSQVATNWQPAAVARACTLAITGCGKACTVFIMVVHKSNKARKWSRSCPAMSAKLWPAENTGPWAARMMPRASLWPTARSACVISRIMSADKALRLSGRLSVRVVIGVCWSSRMWA
jgi:hypothetical protein